MKRLFRALVKGQKGEMSGISLIGTYVLILVLLTVVIMGVIPLAMTGLAGVDLSSALHKLAMEGYVAYGVPSGTWTTIDDLYTQDIYSQADSTYNIGAAGNEYAGVYTDNIVAPTGRTATFTVAASNASAISKVQSDSLCVGTADDIQIQAEIDALVVGGKGDLSEGTYDITTSIRITGNNVTISGRGDATVLRKANQVKSNLFANANAGQPVVVVVSGTGYKTGQMVFLNDNTGINFETSEILTVVGNTVTLTGNLANAYTTAAVSYLTTYFPTFYITGDNVTIDNLKVDGNKANQEDTSGLNNGPDDDWGDIQITGAAYPGLIGVIVDSSQFNGGCLISCTDGKIERCQFDNNISNGLNIHQSNNRVSVSQSSVYNNGDDGFETDNGTTYVNFDNCIARSNADNGFKIGTGGYSAVTGCTSIGDYNGIMGFGTGNTITGNLITGSTNLGIYLWRTQSATVTGNTVVSSAGNGIRLYETGAETLKDTVVSGNTLYDCGSGAEASIQTYKADGFIIEGNTITSVTNDMLAAISIDANSLNGRILGNDLRGVGVANDLIIDASATNIIYHHNSFLTADAPWNYEYSIPAGASYTNAAGTMGGSEPVVELVAGSKYASFSWVAPRDMVSIKQVVVELWGLGDTGTIDWTSDTQWSTTAEAFSTHTDSTTQDGLAITVSIRTEVDISAAFTAWAAGDRGGGKFTLDAMGAPNTGLRVTRFIFRTISTE